MNTKNSKSTKKQIIVRSDGTVDPSAWSNTLKVQKDVERWSKEKPMGGK